MHSIANSLQASLFMDAHFAKFRPDNFTKQSRTPWAGHRVVQTVKGSLNLPFPENVGEFWEFSTSCQLPGYCVAPFNCAFNDLLNAKSDTWLSPSHREIWGNDTPMLIKYIDAAMDLSLQLHPPIQSILPAPYCGKWESWLILGNAPGAGIYLGLATGVTKEMFVNAIYNNLPIKPLLHFVPVKRGEVYTIPPCTLHCLGAGVCVLEPQLLQPGKAAISLRLHDWNRLYDDNGNIRPQGHPRELHIEEALQYVDFNAPRGRTLERRIRCMPNPIHLQAHLKVYHIHHAPCLKGQIIQGTGTYTCDLPGELTALMVLQGACDITVDDKSWHLKSGESGAISACASHISFACSDAVIYLARCVPELYNQTCEYSV